MCNIYNTSWVKTLNLHQDFDGLAIPVILFMSANTLHRASGIVPLARRENFISLHCTAQQ